MTLGRGRFDRLTSAARAAVTAGAGEAARRGDRRIGTDHLLLGVLHDPEIVELLGVDVQTARRHAQVLDDAALTAIGIEVGQHALPSPVVGDTGRAPFTSGARAVIPRAVALAAQSRSRHVGTRHLLIALLEREPPDPAAVLLDDLHVDRIGTRARARS